MAKAGLRWAKDTTGKEEEEEEEETDDPTLPFPQSPEGQFALLQSLRRTVRRLRLRDFFTGKVIGRNPICGSRGQRDNVVRNRSAGAVQ